MLDLSCHTAIVMCYIRCYCALQPSVLELVAGDRPLKPGTILNNLQRLTAPKFIEVFLMLVSHMFGAKICVLTQKFMWTSHSIGQWNLQELDGFQIMILCERNKIFGVNKQPTGSARNLPKVEGVENIEKYLRLERNRRVDAHIFGQTGQRLATTKSRSTIEQVVAHTMLNLPTMMRNAAAATAAAPNASQRYEVYEALQESLLSQMDFPGPSASTSTSTTVPMYDMSQTEWPGLSTSTTQPMYTDPTRAAVPHPMKPITVAQSAQALPCQTPRQIG